MTDRILVVDDSLTVRMNLLRTLAAAGLDATACATLAEARSALAGGGFGLVILDVLLPDGDGIDLLAELREAPATRAIAVMLLSSETEVRDRIRGLKTGADDYVGKPYEPSYLVARARELLRRREPPVPAADAAILVVDDSPTFREALREALERAGHRVVVAESGEEGLRLAAELRPGAMVIDGNLPGIDGPSVIRRIRLDAALRAMPCLLLTGSQARDAEVWALDSGADAFATKDEDIEIVLARLTALLRSAGGAPLPTGTVSLHAPKKILAAASGEADLADLAGALRAAGYDVAAAHSADEALALLAVQPADCVLFDRALPDTGGIAACRRVKAVPALRDVPVIVLGSGDDPATMIDSLAAGADDYIVKSADFAVLRARVVAQLRRRQFEDENRQARERLLHQELAAAEARAAREIAAARALLVEELERKNQELEAFSYSVSHDLRAPLRSIDGFSQALVEDYSAVLPAEAQAHLGRVRAAAQRMGELIDDLLQLSQVGRAPLRRQRVDLSALARAIVADLRRAAPQRDARVVIADGLVVTGDPGLLRALLENLLGNAWKFTAHTADAAIAFDATRADGRTIYAVRDNGAGFDMKFAGRLFAPFQRLHRESEFPGTGIGLATVRRVVDRHGGRVWAEGETGTGAIFYWTLADADAN
jgi:two-component system, NtrC family, sensor kinase